MVGGVLVLFPQREPVPEPAVGDVGACGGERLVDGCTAVLLHFQERGLGVALSQPADECSQQPGQLPGTAPRVGGRSRPRWLPHPQSLR